MTAQKQMHSHLYTCIFTSQINIREARMADNRMAELHDAELSDEALDRTEGERFFCGGSLSAFCTGS